MFKIKFEFSFRILRGNIQFNQRDKKGVTSNLIDFIEFCDLYIHQITGQKGISTILNYQTAVRSLRKYAQYRDDPFTAMDANVIQGYQRWLLQKGISLNTVSCYMRSLRALYHIAVEKGILQLNGSFRKVYTGNAKTDKRSVDLEDVRKLKHLSLKAGSSLEWSRDLFLFSFYALGMPFVDVAFLKWKHINGDTIQYHRHKTGQRITIKIEACMWDILHRLGRHDGEYIFPIITAFDEKEVYLQYKKALNCYNRCLKKLAKQAGIETKLTSYCVRHTWASVAFQQNIELPVISKALGHTNPNTTLVYIKELDDQRLEEANKQLLKEIDVI